MFPVCLLQLVTMDKVLPPVVVFTSGNSRSCYAAVSEGIQQGLMLELPLISCARRWFQLIVKWMKNRLPWRCCILRVIFRKQMVWDQGTVASCAAAEPGGGLRFVKRWPLTSLTLTLAFLNLHHRKLQYVEVTNLSTNWNWHLSHWWHLPQYFHQSSYCTMLNYINM